MGMTEESREDSIQVRGSYKDAKFMENFQLIYHVIKYKNLTIISHSS